MKLIVQGSKAFNDYELFKRGMSVALSDLTDGGEIVVYSLGPKNIHNYAQEFVNITERSLNTYNVSIKFVRANLYMIKDLEFDKFYYFCNDGEYLSRTGQDLEDTDVDVLVFRY